MDEIMGMSNTKKINKHSATGLAQITSEESQTQINAQLAHSTYILNAAVGESFGKSLFPDLDLLKLAHEFKASIATVQSGDMKDMEAMLVAQAHALQTMFVSMARRAQGQENLKPYMAQMTLALKAQAQSRATIQTLAELKFPRQIVLANQANVAHQQQVNHGSDANYPHITNISKEDLHAEKNKIDKNELLEQYNGCQINTHKTLSKAAHKITIAR